MIDHPHLPLNHQTPVALPSVEAQTDELELPFALEAPSPKPSQKLSFIIALPPPTQSPNGLNQLFSDRCRLDAPFDRAHLSRTNQAQEKLIENKKSRKVSFNPHVLVKSTQEQPQHRAGELEAYVTRFIHAFNHRASKLFTRKMNEINTPYHQTLLKTQKKYALYLAKQSIIGITELLHAQTQHQPELNFSSKDKAFHAKAIQRNADARKPHAQRVFKGIIGDTDFHQHLLQQAKTLNQYAKNYQSQVSLSRLIQAPTLSDSSAQQPLSQKVNKVDSNCRHWSDYFFNLMALVTEDRVLNHIHRCIGREFEHLCTMFSCNQTFTDPRSWSFQAAKDDFLQGVKLLREKLSHHRFDQFVPKMMPYVFNHRHLTIHDLWKVQDQFTSLCDAIYGEMLEYHARRVLAQVHLAKQIGPSTPEG